MTEIELSVIVMIAFVIFLIIIIITKIRRILRIKGAVTLPIVKFGFEAIDEQPSVHTSSITDLKGNRVTVGDVTARGSRASASVSRIDASGDITIGDVSSTDSQ